MVASIDFPSVKACSSYLDERSFLLMYKICKVDMMRLHAQVFIWVILMMHQMTGHTIPLDGSWCFQSIRRSQKALELKTDKFYKFEVQSNSWKEVQLPLDLHNCLNGNCTKVDSIGKHKKEVRFNKKMDENFAEYGVQLAENIGFTLPLRRRISVSKLSDTCVWITGESGSIYERFWNGVQWVIAPHDLPISAGYAISVFGINQTVLALNENGILYQLHLNENSQPTWEELQPTFDPSVENIEADSSGGIRVKSGFISHDGKRVYFTTFGGSLLEIREFQPLRWTYHGRPPGGSIAAITGSSTTISDIVFAVNYMGELYELDPTSKPSWKKHIWSEPLGHETSLLPCRGHVMHGLVGAYSLSVFLLSKDGILIERRLHQRKRKWIVHGAPKGHQLSAITPTASDELNAKSYSMFLTTLSGSIYEYQISRSPGKTKGNQTSEAWINHRWPLHAKVAQGIPGLQLQAGRMLFPLDDGRVGEFHLSGLGGQSSGPSNHANTRRKISSKYEWTVIDAPETEGWNAEYCTEGRGPTNCIKGIKDRIGEEELDDSGSMSSTRRRKSQEYQSYVLPRSYNNSGALDQSSFSTRSIQTNFKLRAMQPEKSFFLIANNGITFEHVYSEGIWLWLRHEHPTPMKGVLGIYNGSLFLVDTKGSLFIRERSSDRLVWINCTSMSGGRRVAIGRPWDGMPGKGQPVTVADSLFFVNKNGRLLQFTVAFRKFGWKDCKNPQNIKVSFIVDHEQLRSNIVFVVGSNGRLYQFNKVTELWHEHEQSPHLSLSRLPGTVVRPSTLSLSGSLFMRSQDGGLVEYRWNALDGWNWVEHGTPHKDAIIAAAPGPTFEGNQLFVIGSDGHVYLRYMQDKAWKWKSFGFPSAQNMQSESRGTNEVTNPDCQHDYNNEGAISDLSLDGNWNTKVAPTRPIPFSETAVIFELRDGRLAELRRTGETQWSWTRVITTPTSPGGCSSWTASAS